MDQNLATGTVADMIAAHRALIVHDESLLDKDGNPVSPLAEESGSACDTALLSLLRAPCLNGADVQAKVSHLLDTSLRERGPVLHDLFELDVVADSSLEGPIPALLNSMVVAPTTTDPDPLLAFIREWEAAFDLAETAAQGVPDDEARASWQDHVGPYFKRAEEGDVPAAITAAGAAAALRRVLDFDDLEDQDANLIRAALAFLEREA